MQKQFYRKKLEGKGCKQMKLCNKDCFHCIYNNCIYDDCNKSVITNEERKEQNKERKRQYYQEHKEEIKAKRRERYRKNKICSNFSSQL